MYLSTALSRDQSSFQGARELEGLEEAVVFGDGLGGELAMASSAGV